MAKPKQPAAGAAARTTATLSNGFLFVRAVVLAVGIRAFLWGYVNVQDVVELAHLKNAKYGHTGFLTVFGGFFATFTFSISLLRVLGLALLTPAAGLGALDVITDVLLAVALPVEFFISVAYFGLKTFAPKLLFPKEDINIPVEVDFCLHMLPFLVLSVEFLSPDWAHEYRRARRLSSKLAGQVAFVLGYYLWMLHWSQANGFWPYPLLGVMNAVQRTVFVSVVWVGLAGVMYGASSARNFVWGPVAVTKIGKKVK